MIPDDARRPWYEPAELAALVGVSEARIRAMTQAAELYAVATASGYRIPLGAALRAFAPDQIHPGHEAALPPGSADAWVEALRRERAEAPR
jgi:hypothetical protein